MALPEALVKQIAFIPLGSGPDADLTLSEITNYFLRWCLFPIDGIYIDQFGYDNLAAPLQSDYRARQNTVIDLIRSSNLEVFINGWDIDHCFGTDNDPAYPNTTYNPSVLEDHLQPGDMFCNLGFLYSASAYWQGADLDFQIDKAYKCMDVARNRGIIIATDSSAVA